MRNWYSSLSPVFPRSFSIVKGKKGSPLTEEEVISIRDQAVVVALRPEIAKGIEEERGYQDISGENCWEEWQIQRRQLDQNDTA